MYGHHVHEEAIRRRDLGWMKYTAVCMHFVNAEYDRGRVFFRWPVLILPNDTPDTLATRVNIEEHLKQSPVSNLVLRREIKLVGHRLIVPKNWPYLAIPDQN